MFPFYVNINNILEGKSYLKMSEKNIIYIVANLA